MPTLAPPVPPGEYRGSIPTARTAASSPHPLQQCHTLETGLIEQTPGDALAAGCQGVVHLLLLFGRHGGVAELLLRGQHGVDVLLEGDIGRQVRADAAAELLLPHGRHALVGLLLGHILLGLERLQLLDLLLQLLDLFLHVVLGAVQRGGQQ